MNNTFDFKWLKSQINIQQVLSAYQLDGRLKEKNDTLYGPCPLHGGNKVIPNKEYTIKQQPLVR